jgi:hypothetical protein
VPCTSCAGHSAIPEAALSVTRDGDDVSALTEPVLAEVIGENDVGSSYTVVYRYDFDGQRFYGKTSIYVKTMAPDFKFGICVNPSIPSQHTKMNPGCPPTDPSGLFEGLEEMPEL